MELSVDEKPIAPLRKATGCQLFIARVADACACTTRTDTVAADAGVRLPLPQSSGYPSGGLRRQSEFTQQQPQLRQLRAR